MLEDVFVCASQRNDQEVISLTNTSFSIHDKSLTLTPNVFMVIAVEFGCG